MIAVDYNKVEDAVLKKALGIFGQSAVNFFNIDTKIIAPAETEIKNIEIKTGYTDYLFYTDDGNYLHFEFQTTDKRDDIKRFLYYDASLFYRDKKKVRTVVIYSADIGKADEYIDAVTIKYGVEAIYMKQFDGDEKLEYLKKKIERREKLSNEDILTLTMLPLMSGKGSRSERAIESIELTDNLEDSENKLRCLSLLYALLDKFGDKISRKKLKEMITMTEIGKMIRDEGIEEGIEKGKTKGKSEIIIRLLVKKFKKVPEEYIDRIKFLSDETLECVATDIFDMESVEDLKKYF
ncbi:DUF4351 domain-containing protein [Clostridium ljungdahlii]|uniref:DUF4351 domain-containing protein n=1 Tax=Clostridium ljungdahlii TaxID=1538 RepID=A0A168LXP7_9CLOT|nr:DUF4351 domain-containing protein [Clostridium ljungdahlii]OAA83837.1 hypothetical protein WY13_02966 [Clostridium ljungdahlii]